jgi:hypothetical protein
LCDCARVGKRDMHTSGYGLYLRAMLRLEVVEAFDGTSRYEFREPQRVE